MSEQRRIEVGSAADGSRVSLPVEQVLTGRAFLTGKSGSGKSNSASVVIEELLEAGYPVLVVDTDGEYYGLKEQYELLHAGADEECDIRVGPEHAERIASIALEENVPVILDVSGYLEEGEADALIRETARHLFAKEKKLKKPFLLVIEEVHEYIPEGGGMDDTGRMLIKVGKRGRKHGLGIVGISQRPADVKKDFITQANWLVWHRLTWENDTKVVGRVVGGEYADAVADLDDGEAFVQRDWTDDEVARVQFDRKRTFDAGATPGLEDVERPDLKSVSDSLVDDLESISERRERERDRIEELEGELADREERIEELEGELAAARDVSRAAERMAKALSEGVEDEPFGYEERLRRKNDRIRELEAEVDELEATVEELRGRLEAADGQRTVGGFAAAANGAGQGADGGDQGADGAGRGPDGGGTAEPRGIDDELIDEHMERLRERGESMDGPALELWPSPIEGASGPREQADEDAGGAADRVGRPDELLDLLHAEPVVARIDGAGRESDLNHEHTWRAVAALVSRGPLALDSIDGFVDAPTESVGSLLSELKRRSLVVRRDGRRYALDRGEMERLVEEADRRASVGELGRQWEVG